MTTLQPATLPGHEGHSLGEQPGVTPSVVSPGQKHRQCHECGKYFNRKWRSLLEVSVLVDLKIISKHIIQEMKLKSLE